MQNSQLQESRTKETTRQKKPGSEEREEENRKRKLTC